MKKILLKYRFSNEKKIIAQRLRKNIYKQIMSKTKSYQFTKTAYKNKFKTLFLKHNGIGIKNTSENFK